jgi:hypothetical protein
MLIIQMMASRFRLCLEKLRVVSSKVGGVE